MILTFIKPYTPFLIECFILKLDGLLGKTCNQRSPFL